LEHDNENLKEVQEENKEKTLDLEVIKTKAIELNENMRSKQK
jgi:hypothetical protein